MRRIALLGCSLVLGLTACGGGGTGSSATGSNAAASFPPQVPLVYTGATTGAAVTSTTAGATASNVMGASTAGASSSLLAGVSAQSDAQASVQPAGAAGLMRRLAQALRSDALAHAGTNGALAGAAIDQTIPCDSGTMQISGSLDANNTGTVNVAYNACRSGPDTINGPASVKVNSYDSTAKVITDAVVTFTRVNFTGPGINSDFTGTLASHVDVGNAVETLTQNIVTQDNNTAGHMTRTQDLVIVNTFDDVNSASFFTQSIRGRVFDSVAGFVDVTTTTAPFTAPWGPLYFSTKSQGFPDWGIIDINGTTGHVRITAIGPDLAKVQVDADGDGVFENSARMRWADFRTSIGADLADNDGDGMHNSWETAMGLNPNDAGDANADSDADSFTNKTEYLAGTDPRTNGSVPPPVRHLWVTDVRDLAFDPASGMIQVFTSSGSGVLLDTVTRELGTTFAGAADPAGRGHQSVTDASGRTWTLTPTAVPTTWTITSSTGATLTINNVAGTNPGSLIRYGAHGLAFITDGAVSPGYIYLVDSTALVP